MNIENELKRLQTKFKSIESIDDTMDRTYHKASPEQDDSIVDAQETKVDKDFMNSSFRTPFSRKKSSINSSLEYSLKTHRINCSPSIKSRLSTSPHRNMSYTDIRLKRAMNYQPFKSRAVNSDIKAPHRAWAKPLSTSPKRFIKIPSLESSEDNDEHDSTHYKPYVLVNNSRPR